ncbi:ATP-binding protein [Streptomyces sp. NPDC049954]|uniref:ATP-binding protein n=1 Tax=Streptomyces sp. NPDC049954 TaxID=3155779 RepID=UPI0034140670
MDHASPVSAPPGGRIRLPRRRPSVRKARDYVRSLGATWGLEGEQLDSVLLVVSELVTNAVLHARCGPGRQVALTLIREPGRVRVEVRDAGDGEPQPRKGIPFTEEHGRGLAVVAELAADWGVAREVVGKTVWATVATGEGRSGDDVPVGREAQPCDP